VVHATADLFAYQPIPWTSFVFATEIIAARETLVKIRDEANDHRAVREVISQDGFACHAESRCRANETSLTSGKQPAIARAITETAEEPALGTRIRFNTNSLYAPR